MAYAIFVEMTLTDWIAPNSDDRFVASWSKGKLIASSLDERTRARLTEVVGQHLTNMLETARSKPTLLDPSALSEVDDPVLRASIDDILAARVVVADQEANAVGWILVADAIGDRLAKSEPSRIAVEQTYRLAGVPAGFTDRVEASFLLALDKSPSARAAWLSFLEPVPDTLITALASEIGPGVRDIAADWSKADDAFTIFDASYRRGGVSWSNEVAWTHTRLRLLLACDLGAWARAFDSLPIPHLMWDFAQLFLTASGPSKLEELVQLAPPVFDENGQWTRSVAVLISAEIVLDMMRSIHDAMYSASQHPFHPQNEEIEERKKRAQRRLEEFERSDLKNWAVDVFTRLLARPDGLPVALEQASRLARVLTIGEWAQNAGRWSPTETTLDAICDTAASKSINTNDCYRWWEGREQRESERPSANARNNGTLEGPPRLRAEGLPYCIAAIGVLHARQNTVANIDAASAALEAQRIWDWLGALFIGRDPGLELFSVRHSNFGFRYTGRALCLLSDPVAAWMALWSRLESHRRTAACGAFEQTALIRTSVDLVWVGLFGCVDWLGVAGIGVAEAARAFYFELVERARLMHLRAPGIDVHARQVRQVLVGGFEFARRLLGESMIADLASLIEPVANDPILLRDIMSGLRSQGGDDRFINEICEALGVKESEIIDVANRLSPPIPGIGN